MQVAAVAKARTLAFIELIELNRAGTVRLQDVVPSLVKRYGFLGFPSKLEDFNIEGDGSSFISGKLGDIVVDSMKIYSGLINVETLSSTSDSKDFILDMLNWGAREMNLTFTEDMIRHWAYVSKVTFLTDFPILRSVSPALDNLARKTSDQIAEIFGIRLHITQ